MKTSMTLAVCLAHSLLLRTTYTACYCSLPSRRNITVITFCKHLRLQFYCTPLLPLPPQTPLSSQGNFAAVVVELCNCANCSVHKLKKSKCTAASRDTAQQDDNSSHKHTNKHTYKCTHVHTYVLESTCITGVTAKSSSARNESVTVINFYNGKELRATM